MGVYGRRQLEEKRERRRRRERAWRCLPAAPAAPGQAQHEPRLPAARAASRGITFQLRQRGELHGAALRPELRRALRALLLQSLAHRPPREAVHFLRGGDRRRHGCARERRPGGWPPTLPSRIGLSPGSRERGRRGGASAVPWPGGREGARRGGTRDPAARTGAALPSQERGSCPRGTPARRRQKSFRSAVRRARRRRAPRGFLPRRGKERKKSLKKCGEPPGSGCRREDELQRLSVQGGGGPAGIPAPASVGGRLH